LLLCGHATNPITTQVEGPTNIITLVVDLENPLMQKKGEEQSFLGSTLFGHVLSQVVATPFTCKTDERKIQLVVDYNISQVVTFDEYLNIM
jgi:hypothetical protein